jgi:SAM-dependent methyltransferase
MVSETTSYARALGLSAAERDRLIAQAEELTPSSRSLLDRIGLTDGWQAIDVGCGPIGILELLAERVGPTGEVVGLDSARSFLDIAAGVAAERALGNVTLVEADAAASGLAPSSFDLVHERLVLIGPTREGIAREMIRLARPGAVIAAQEIDISGAFCEPAHPAWDRLLRAFRESVARVGAEPAIGRRLAAILTSAGVEDVELEVTARLDPPGSARRTQVLDLVENARPGILRAGLLDESELAVRLSELRAHLADPATIVFGGLLFQAWGRRPATA